MNQIVDLAYRVTDYLPKMMRANSMLQLFGSFVAPLIGVVQPTIVALDDERCVVEVPLNRRTRNRMFNGMYVGVYGIAADIVGGTLVQHWIRRQSRPISMIVKDMQIDLLRRAEGHVRFESLDSRAIGAMVAAAAQSSERHHATIDVVATTTLEGVESVVARMKITMSVKAR